jgi:hypothetical protein
VRAGTPPGLAGHFTRGGLAEGERVDPQVPDSERRQHVSQWLIAQVDPLLGGAQGVLEGVERGKRQADPLARL